MRNDTFKFEQQRQQLQEEMEKKLAKIEEDENKERQKRVSPLVSKYTNVFEEVTKKIVSKNVERLENVRFKKTDVKKRLEDLFEAELELLISEGEEENKLKTVEGQAEKINADDAKKKANEEEKNPE